MNSPKLDKTCMGMPCQCEVEEKLSMGKPQGRKTFVPLNFPSNDDYSEEILAYQAGLRRGDVTAFLQYNPEIILLERELLAEKEEDSCVAYALCQQILSQLTERQIAILHLRGEEISFREIAETVGLCERSVYYEWGKIREIANRIVGGD